MSLFRFVKYSSILYFLGKHRSKLFRSAAVLLFAFITSLLYDDLRLYLESQHPQSLIYALIAKVVIVYGSLVFVLMQFRPNNLREKQGAKRAASMAHSGADTAMTGKPGARNQGAGQANAGREAGDRLDALADIDSHAHLRTRYDRILAGERSPRGARTTEPDN